MTIKILAIDDDTATTELLTILLQSHDFKITAVNSGQEGINLIKKTKPDIILLDLMMPDMDGWETCKKIRDFSNIPIIILSALDTPGMVASALDTGADDYLIKPVSSNLLIAHIKNLTRRSTGQLYPSPSMMNPSKKAELGFS